MLCFAGLLSACSNKTGPAPLANGEIDRSGIATDTTTEVNMDLSYEYQKALVQNDSTVYDFLAYDKPKSNGSKIWEGKLLVIKRTRAGQDTVIRDQRSGPVHGLSLVYIDRDMRPSIMFYEYKDRARLHWQLHIYRPGPDERFEGSLFKDMDAPSSPGHYRGADTFFVYQGHIIRRYPYFGQDSSQPATCWQSFNLGKGKLMLENEKIVP